MKSSEKIFCFIASIILLFYGENHCTQEGMQRSYSRIISCAPSITETLFALSLGDRVVGVSDFCKVPQEVAKTPKIGGYTNPHYEMIIRLNPDLVILLQEHVQILEFLKKNKIEYLLIDNHNLSSILESFLAIGKKCGKIEKAEQLIQAIQSEMLKDSIGDLIPPQVFLCVDRENQGNGKIYRAYAAGNLTFYHDLMKRAGMNNSIIDSKIAYPQVSDEGIIRMQPDIIIDITMNSKRIELNNIESDWHSLPMVSAVKNNMVFCLSGDYLTIPGPRIFRILMDFKRILSLYRQRNKAH
jgi:iron complex transport system substrate-binding protein